MPVQTWPDQALLLPAVDAQTGEPVIFTRASGVDLADAVAAGCAVPGIWPPVTIDGRRYVDGGIRSATNADLAAGSDRVLVITPALADTLPPWGSLDDEIELLKPADARVVYADAASLAAFGTNPLSPATRGPAARGTRNWPGPGRRPRPVLALTPDCCPDGRSQTTAARRPPARQATTRRPRPGSREPLRAVSLGH